MKKTMKAVTAAVAMAALLGLAGSSFAAKQPPAAPVNVNQATVEQLMTVPGIGATKAAAIVAYRTNTPFAKAEELVNVKGIGEKLFAKIAPYVTVSGEAQQPGTAAKASR